METALHKFTSLTARLFIGILFSLCLRNSTAMAGWQTETVDSEGNVGEFTSLAFDLSGNPAISYYAGTNGALKFARFNGTSWDITTVDSEGHVGFFPSLAFDLSGNPAISYLDGTNDDLKFARFNGTSWDITTVDSEGRVGYSPSLAFDLSGNPAISYSGGTITIKYASFNGASWDITIVDPNGGSAFSGDSRVTSLAFNASGNPAIAYHDSTNGSLKFARFNGASWDITTVDPKSESSLMGIYPSLAFDASGNQAISYATVTSGGPPSGSRDFDLKYAHFNGTSWDITFVDVAGKVGLHTSLAFDSSGNPSISYRDWTNGSLKYARFVPVITTTTTTTSTTTTTTTFVCRCLGAGCISGTVAEVGTEEPLAGKTVILKRVFPKRPRIRKMVATGVEGCYHFVNLEDGVYRLKIRKCKGGHRETVVIAGGGKRNNVNFECKK